MNNGEVAAQGAGADFQNGEVRDALYSKHRADKEH